MRINKITGLLTVLLATILAVLGLRADYNPTNPPEPGGVTVTARVVPSGAGSVSPSRKVVQPGETVQLRAYASTNYRFVEWLDDGGSSISTSSSYNYVAGDKDASFTARFEYVPSSPAEPVTPAAKGRVSCMVRPSGAGSVNGAGTYDAGTKVSLRAYANSNFVFENWTIGSEVIGTSSSITYTVREGENLLCANYRFDPSSPSEPTTPARQHRLYVKSVPAGSCTFNIVSGTKYAEGSGVTLTAYPASGFVFRSWRDKAGNVLSGNRSMTVNMGAEDMTLTANCEFSPDNPSEPASPQPSRNIIYGGRELVMPGADFVYNVLLENADKVTGINIDVVMPEVAVLDMDQATLSTRAGAHTLQTEQVDDTTWRFMVRGTEPMSGANGAVIRIPGHLDASAEVDTTIPVRIAKGVVYKADGTQTPVDVIDGSVKVMAIPETLPDSPDFVVSDINVTGGEVGPGDPLDISWRVENRGNIAATGGWSETLYLTDSEGRRSTLGTLHYEGDNLEAGAGVSRAATLTIGALPGLSGPVNVAVSLTPNATSGEVEEYQANNTTAGTGYPLMLAKELQLKLPAEVTEGKDRQLRGQLVRSGNWTAAETFGVAVENADARLTVPQSITIPAGQSAVYFELALADNDTADGDTEVSLTVSGNGYEAVTGKIAIADNELPQLELTAEPDEVIEGESLTLTVTVPKAPVSDLEVKLATDIGGRIELPQTLTIKGGETSVSAIVPAMQNERVDGDAELSVVASATRYLSGEVLLTVMDDDIPALDLTLTPGEVSEDAGAAAITGVITRSNNFDKKVTIEIRDDSNGRLYYTTQRVEMGAGVKSIEFPIGVKDNNLVDGDLDVEVTAAVYISSCSCSAPVSSVGSVSRQVRIIDNDGPSLSIKSDMSVITEGDSDGVTLTVSRNTLPGQALNVSLSSDADEVLEYPREVVIPADRTSVSVKVTATANDVEDDSRTVVFSAEAEGYAKATWWAMISDSTLPDAKVATPELSVTEGMPGTEVTAVVRVLNMGSLRLQEAVQVDLMLDGKNVATAYTAQYIAPAGAEDVTMTFNLPEATGSYQLTAVVNGNKNAKEHLYTNNSSMPVEVHVKAPYTAVVTVGEAIYDPGEEVAISGQLTGESISDVDVEVYVVNSGARQTLTAHTDATGAFTTVYKPYSTQYGHFAAGACYPGEKLTVEQAGFDIYGISYDNSRPVVCHLTTGEPYSGKLKLTNPGTLPISGVQVEVAEASDDVDVEVSIPGTIAPGSSVELPYKLTARQGTTGEEWLEVKLRVTSSEAAALPLTIYYYATTPAAALTASVESIETNLSMEEPMEYPFTITNTGGQETGRITLSLPDWMESVTPAAMPSLAPGEEATVVLKLTSNDRMNLNMAVTGNIAVNTEKGNGVTLPYRIVPVTNRTGELKVVVCDQYTYYTEEAPNVAHAEVTISNPTTGLPVLLTDTGEEGTCTVELQAGYYQLDVQAEKHEAFRDFVYVSPGELKTVTVNISYNPISISWDVEETEVEDEYKVETNVTYETNVPMPVVKVTLPKSIDGDNMAVGDATMITMNLTNIGLMRAYDVRLLIPDGMTEWKFEALDYTEPFELDAQQSVDVPIRITRIADESKEQVRRKSVAGNMITNYGNCMTAAGNSYKGMCGKDWKENVAAEKMAMKMCATSATMMAIGEILEKVYKNGWIMPMVPGGGRGGGGGDGPGGGGYYGTPQSTFSLCNPCDAQMASDLIDKLFELTPAKTFNETLNDVIENYKDTHGEGNYHFVVKKMGEDLGDYTEDEFKEAFAGELSKGVDMIEFAVEVYQISKSCEEDGGDKKVRRAAGASGSGNSMSDVFTEVGQRYAGYLKTMYDLQLMAYGDSIWCREQSMEKFRYMQYVYSQPDGFIPDDAEIERNRPESVTFAQAKALFEHVNGLSATFPTQEAFDAKVAEFEAGQQEAVAAGYANMTEQFSTTYDNYVEYLHDMQSNSVCATVSLRISQTMTMTRQAFRGTLTVFNGHESVPMRDLTLNLVVRDDKGNVATSHEFQMNAETLEGFTGALELPGGWELAAGETGTATVLFIPTKYAAPDKGVRYSFGGSISYVDPYSGLVVTRSLYPSVLTVKPSPELDLTYFMQRNVYADDPLTPERVEPTDAAEFALVLKNKGMGDATGVRMVTEQPVITENEKGLLIDFELVSSQLNGKDKTLSLGGTIATDFGTIPAGKTAYAQWWLESSLLGHFLDYDVSASHVTSYGNPDLSLLDQVTIHELVHGFTVDAEGEMPLRGFLVNDILDADDRADTVYFSDGSAETGASQSSSMTSEKVSDNVYQVTVTANVTGDGGWYFGSMDDPTGGRKRLISVIRDSDGKELPVDNFWQTWCTIADGKDPVHETLLHGVVVMTGQQQSYTLTFEPRPDVELEVERFRGVERDESLTQPLDKLGVVFNKDVDGSTFTVEDLQLTCAGRSVSLEPAGVVQMNHREFEIDFGPATSKSGSYVLTVLTEGITDADGYTGRGGRNITWVQALDASGTESVLAGHDGLLVTPVPVGDHMTVECTSGTIDTLMMLDMAGGKVREWRDVPSGSQLDVHGIAPGGYLVTGLAEGRRMVVKVIKK